MITYNDDGYILSCPKCGSGDMIKKGFTPAQVSRQRYLCHGCGYRTAYPVLAEEDMIIENVKLSKQKQRFQDTNRIERKTAREYYRIDNAITVFNQKLLDVLGEYKLNEKIIKHPKKKQKAVGVIQLSDLHLNELVSLSVNSYDFEIASKRLKKHITGCKKYFATQSMRKVVLALTGDLINSDRRLDELLNKSTNRASAVFVAVDMIQQAILDLNDSYEVSIACVSGNESRVHRDPGWSDILATDNYDFTIFNMLRALFVDSTVEFISGDPMELVISVAGQNVLLIHGYGVMKGKVETSISQLIGRYSNHDVKIDYVLLGDIHSARVGDNYGRSSSMIGANEYSERSLNLIGRASQNCYIFHENGNRDGIKIDLQNIDEVEGYDIEKSIKAYNPKSHDKTIQKHTIFEIKV